MQGVINSTTFSMRMDVKTREQLEKEAKKIDRSASYIVLKALKSYLQKKEAKRQAIEEALKEADKGIFVSEKTVDTWFYSLGTEDELDFSKADIFPNQK